MKRQFTVITKDGSKWLRPINPHPEKLSTHGTPEAFYYNPEWQEFEKSNFDAPYLGSHPEGTTLDEIEVREVGQLMICGAWVEYEESMDILSSQERKAYVDVRNKIRLGANRGYVLVDEDDYNTLSQYKWHLSTDGTARNKDVGMMHRFITNAPKGMVVDHINHNRLDNRKINLRVCTHSENMRNQLRRTDGSSKYKGVSWDKKGDRWRACIEVDGRQLYLGLFTSEIEAARAYDEAAIRRFGDFSLTNFPVNNYSYVYIDAKSHERHISDDYWRRRCEAAEGYIKESPCDHDITRAQKAAYNAWQEIVNQEPGNNDQSV